MDAQDHNAGMRENPLAFVSEGMKVYDQEGEEVGIVERVFAGADPIEEGVNAESNTPDEPDRAREGLWDSFEDVFDPVDQLAEDMQLDLWSSGFMRVNSQELTGEQRYITSHRIADVSGGKVHLTVPLDELVRR